MRKVDLNITISVSPQQLIQAFTDPEMLKTWWGVDKCFIQNKVGGLYTLAWMGSEASMAYISTGRITRFDNELEIEISDFLYLSYEKSFLGPMRLYIKAEESNDGCQVYLCQDGYQEGGDWEWYYEAVQKAWPVVLNQLKQYLES